MKKQWFLIATLILLFLTAQSDASVSKHMISVSSQGFGASYDAERMATLNKSAFDKVDRIFTGFAFNYAYSLSSRFQIGTYYGASSEKYDFKPKGSGESTSEVKSESYGAFLLYNLSEKIEDAFYISILIGHFNHEEENSKSLQTAEGKSPHELDDAGMLYEIIFGKRFSLINQKNKHLSYSPMLGLYRQTHSKDFDDQHIKNGIGINFHLIKFDFLF